MKLRYYLLVLTMMCMQPVSNAQGGLCISEILFQPHSGEAEYVELYNNGGSPIELSDYLIIRWLNDSLGSSYRLPSHTVAPYDYVVLTKDAASVTGNYDVKYPGKLVECNLPPYPNDGGSVVLAHSDRTVVEKFDYSPSMHSRLLRNKAGVSLERRRFDVECNANGNWFSAASTAGYGTPTYTNSQSQEWIAEEVSFEISSTLLSPDGDGYQDELLISYQLDDNDIYGQIAVYDSRGQKTCTLLNDGLLGTHGEVLWDGKGTDGTRLPMGRYVLYINLYDLHGTRQIIKRAVSVVY